VIIRFGHDWDETCMQMDEVLSSTSDKMKNFAVTYLVDISEVPDFNAMYELYDPCTVMFFFRNKVKSTILGINEEIREKNSFLMLFFAFLLGLQMTGR
jgi:U5 snRNP protein, DIM1 family